MINAQNKNDKQAVLTIVSKYGAQLKNVAEEIKDDKDGGSHCCE